MGKFQIGDRVRSTFDERPMVNDDPLLSMLLTLAGNRDRMEHSLAVMPVPEGTVVGVNVTYVRPELGITLHDAVLVDLIDGRQVPYTEDMLELVESFDDELDGLLKEANAMSETATFKVGDRVREKESAMLRNNPGTCALLGCDGSMHDETPATGEVVKVAAGEYRVRIDEGTSELAGGTYSYYPWELELINKSEYTLG